jgi:hypothetical protein
MVTTVLPSVRAVAGDVDEQPDAPGKHPPQTSSRRVGEVTTADGRHFRDDLRGMTGDIATGSRRD